jgi:hypothetical protein
MESNPPRWVVKPTEAMEVARVDTPVPVENRARLSPEDFTRLATVLASQHSMKHTLEWLLSHQPPPAPSDIITQDEFSHDILVAYRGELYLVYDST